MEDSTSAVAVESLKDQPREGGDLNTRLLLPNGSALDEGRGGISFHNSPYRCRW
ncbi:hypothetical protein J6590_103502, partial [Homalodisca vitripennis]